MLIETAMAFAAYTSTPADDLSVMEAMASDDSVSVGCTFNVIEFGYGVIGHIKEHLPQHGNESQHATPSMK
jgi:hypothetical protein